MGDIFSLGQKLILWGIPLLFAITVHEVAHGWVASRCGDTTAQRLGRLTLNPLKHIDLLGTVLVPTVLFLVSGFIFGWAKPIPIASTQLKHPRRDMALIAAAGPLANLSMAFLWGVVAKISTLFNSIAFIYMAQGGVLINLVLLLLNLIPIPPLDGSRILTSLVPLSFARQLNKLEGYGFLILILFLVSGVLMRALNPLLQSLLAIFNRILGL